MKRGLVITFVANYRAQLDGFPAFFNRVEGGVENSGVSMQLGVYRLGVAFRYRAGSAMDVFRPDHVAGCAVMVGAVLAHARLNVRLHFRHRFPYRFPEGGEDSVIASELVSERYRFAAVECHIGHYPAVGIGARSELLSVRRQVVAEPEKILLLHLAGEL